MEEGVESFGEGRGGGPCARGEAREFEHEHPDVFAVRREGGQKRTAEKIRIKKPRIGVAGAGAEAIEPWKLSKGEISGDFKREAKPVRDLGAEGSDAGGRGERIISGIYGNRGENLSVFAQAFAGEPSLGEFPSGVIAFGSVEPSQPAWIFPRGGADEDVLGGQFTDGLPQAMPPLRPDRCGFGEER